jgi:ribose 5-phosphate isomerase B
MPFEKIFIASDHAGFEMKRRLIEESGLEMIDLGPGNSESCDYPIFARKLTGRMAETGNAFGVLVCHTGIGMTIAANRCRHIRAALCSDEKTAGLARRHNDANVAVFGAGSISPETALDCLRIFLATEFEGGRHARRLQLIDDNVSESRFET